MGVLRAGNVDSAVPAGSKAAQAVLGRLPAPLASGNRPMSRCMPFSNTAFK